MIEIDDELNERLEREAGERGMIMRDYIAERLSQIIPPVDEAKDALTIDKLGLHECAERLLEELDPDHARIIRDVCGESQQSPAAYIISIMRLSRERGEMVPPLQEIDIPLPAYGFSANAGQPIAVTCEWCRKEFIPTRKGQIYCPTVEVEGEESCARKAALAPRREKKKERSQFQPPKHSVVG